MMKIGRVKKNAVVLFQVSMFNKFGNAIPESQIKFEKILKRIEGQIFFIGEVEGTKMFLKYPESMHFVGKLNTKIEGVYLHTDLVDVFKVKKE